MKLAFCLFHYFPYGGLQRDFLRIAKLAEQRGHEVHVYTARWEGETEPAFHLHLIEPRGWQNHTRCVSFAKQLSSLLKEQSCDLVVGFNKLPGLDLYYAADVCYQSRAKERHGYWYQLLPRYRHMVALERAVFAAEKPTHILLIASNQETHYRQCYQTEPSRFHLLPPGIAKDRMAPSNAADIRSQVRVGHNVLNDQHVMLMVGSGFKTKGLDRAIKSLAALPIALRQQTVLWVLGQDHSRCFVRLAEQCGVAGQVKFLGGRPNVLDYLLAADVLVHPAYHENTGTVLLEALAAGLPVLTVDVCGYAHYVTEANAGKVLSSPFHQENLTEALASMLQSSEPIHWRENALAFARQADIYSLPEKAMAFIEKMGSQADAIFER